jgi:hypothetical protein
MASSASEVGTDMGTDVHSDVWNGAVTRADRAASRRERFAAWRRGRPFWGAALTIVAGVVLWFSGRLQFDTFEFQLGIEGAQSTILPIGIVVLGALVLAQPHFHLFYGILTLVVAVYSLLGVNLGGFGIGMVLGVVGGVTVVSWRAESPPARVLQPAPETGADDAEPTAAKQSPAASGGRHTAAVAVAAALVLGSPPAAATGTAGPTAPVASGVEQGPVLCALFGVTCEDDEPETDPSAEPSAGPSATTEPSASPSSSEGGDPSGGGTGGEGTGGDDAGEDDAGGAGGEAAGGAPDEGAAAGERTEAQAEEAVTDAVALELGDCVRVTFGGEYDVNLSLPGDCGVREDANVFSLDGELETRDLQLPLDGINGISVVNVPVTTDGPRRDALKLSVDHVKVPGFWLRTYAYSDGHVAGTETNAGYVSMTGDAQMYLSSIHANLPGDDDVAELADKAAQGSSVVEILLGLTDARLGFMGATSDQQVWSDFREQVWAQG